jgi:hypothetical protein
MNVDASPGCKSGISTLAVDLYGFDIERMRTVSISES